MTVLHRPTVVRLLLVSAGVTFVAFTAAEVLAPTLVDLFGADAARRVTLVGGFVARVVAGRAATRRTWVQGADVALVLACVVVGGALGWLLFPGVVSLAGLASSGAAPDDLVDLLADLGLFLLALALGALTARWGRRTGRS